MTCMVSSRPKKGTRPVFKFFSCSNDFITYFRFPCFLLVSRVWYISSGIGPCFPLAGRLCKFYANDGGTTNIAPTTLSEIQASSQSTFLNTQLYSIVIRKNKQLTIIKPKQTCIYREKYTFCYIKSLEHLNSLRNGPAFISA
jgi:hypothetical protein